MVGVLLTRLTRLLQRCRPPRRCTSPPPPPPSKFRTVRAQAILDRPPVPPGAEVSKSTGVPCWKMVTVVYALPTSSMGAAPRPIGSIRTYHTEFAELQREAANAYALLRRDERQRGNRSLVCGDGSVTLCTSIPGSQCEGSYFLSFEMAPHYKKLL